MNHGTALSFVRMTQADNPQYEKAMGLYAQSFPYHEQREPSSQAAVLNKPAYHFDMLFDRNVFVGLMLSWQTEGFVYVEHFCIMPDLRGRGYGGLALAQLAGKPSFWKLILPWTRYPSAGSAFMKRLDTRPTPIPMFILRITRAARATHWWLCPSPGGSPRRNTRRSGCT